MVKLARLGQTAPVAAPSQGVVHTKPAQQSPKSTTHHATARVQIRPQGIPGAPPSIVKVLSATDTMHDLATSLLADDNLPGYSLDRAKFMQVYPRKEYLRSEWGKPLQDSGGLVPSGTVM